MLNYENFCQHFLYYVFLFFMYSFFLNKMIKKELLLLSITQKHPLFILPCKINEINITPHLHVKYRARAKAKEAA